MIKLTSVSFILHMTKEKNTYENAQNFANLANIPYYIMYVFKSRLFEAIERNKKYI